MCNKKAKKVKDSFISWFPESFIADCHLSVRILSRRYGITTLSSCERARQWL